MAAEGAEPPHREEGWALVSTLCVVSLLAVMAAGAEGLTLMSARAERATTALAVADADLDAGLMRAIAAIDDARPSARWRIDGEPHGFDFDGAHMTIAIQDELGKIDLNAADVSLLRSLLRAAGGLDSDAAAALADKIVDWRASTDLASLHGATSADYAAAGYAYRPRHGPFQSVDELRLVMGMTPALFARIRPALTVYTKKPAFDQNTAPREALAALTPDDPDQADAAIARRSEAAGNGGIAPMGVWDTANSLSGRVFSIAITASRSGKRFSRDAVVLLTGKAKQPCLVLSWR